MGEQNFDKQPYYLTIRIIRHPLDSLYSFYLWNQQYQKEAAENFIPKDLLEEYVYSWKEFQMYWDAQKNVITIRYEDFYKEPAKHLRIILEAIGYKTTTADIKRAVQKYPPTGGFLKYLNHFTKEDKAFIETELAELMSTYDYEMTTILWDSCNLFIN